MANTNTIYPWVDWLSKKNLGKPFLLVRGKDFKPMTLVMAQMIRNRAWKAGFRASIIHQNERVIEVTINRGKQ